MRAEKNNAVDNTKNEMQKKIVEIERDRKKKETEAENILMEK